MGGVARCKLANGPCAREILRAIMCAWQFRLAFNTFVRNWILEASVGLRYALRTPMAKHVREDEDPS